MSARALPISIALVVIGAALAVGCGGGDSGSSTSAALSKEEFISQADAICKQGNQDINAAGKEIFGGGKPTQDQIDQFVNDSVIPSIQGQVDDIRALTPPAGDEDTINNLLDDVESALDQAKSDPTVLTGNGSGPFAKANEEAQAYGLKECGK